MFCGEQNRATRRLLLSSLGTPEGGEPAQSQLRGRVRILYLLEELSEHYGAPGDRPEKDGRDIKQRARCCVGFSGTPDLTELLRTEQAETRGRPKRQQAG